MEKTPESSDRNSRARKRMSSVVIRTLSVNEAIATALSRWSTKFICQRVKTSARTVENWKQAKTSPQAKHIAAMMSDDELCAAVLTALGRADIATRARMVAALKETRDALTDATGEER
jgi:hypothetical protein